MVVAFIVLSLHLFLHGKRQIMKLLKIKHDEKCSTQIYSSPLNMLGSNTGMKGLDPDATDVRRSSKIKLVHYMK